MTTTTGERTRVPVLTTADRALEVARSLAGRFATRAVERDRDRRLPYAEVQELKGSGLLSVTVPREFGGPGLPPSVLAKVLAIIAEADPNLAQIPHSHFVYANLIRVAASHSQAEDLYRQILNGALLANAQSERGGATITDIASRISPDGRGGLVLEGTKYYCTGTLFADVIPVLTRVDDPRGQSGLRDGDHIVFVPATTTGVAISDDWDAVGQRTTASGTARFDQVAVRPEWVVPRSGALDNPHGYGAFAQLLHASIEVGIARGALASAAEFVRTKSRPWFEAQVEHAVDDPFVVQRFGELDVEVRTADAMLTEAGVRVDAVFERPGPERAAEASLAVAGLKVVAERVALAVSSALFEVAGTRSAAAGERLDRFWRNARTHTLHDPVRWKLQHLGRHALTGVLPPSHGTV